MIHPTLLLTLLSLAGASAAPGTPPAAPELLRFSPAAEQALGRTLRVQHELTLEYVGYSRDGGAMVKDGSRGLVSTWFNVGVVDRFQALGDGRPTRFERRYVDLGGEGSLALRRGPQEKSWEERVVSVSPLTERTVEFTWIPEEGDWSRRWRRDEAEEWWLAELDGDMDLLAALPAGEVAVGQQWELPASAARRLLAPGGNHLMTPRTGNVFGRSVEVGVGGDLADVLSEEPVGRITARFAGERAVDGQRLAVVELEIQGLHSVVDRTDLWRTSMPIEEKRERSRLLSALIEYTLDARGELTWDLDAGRFHALELSGREGFNLAVAKQMSDAGGTFERTQQSAFRGNMTLSYRCVDPDEVAPTAPSDH